MSDIKISVDFDTIRQVQRLVDMITGSEPNTEIRGEIESAAMYLGHCSEILNSHLYRIEDKE